MNIYSKKFSERLKYIRKQAKISQEELAEILNTQQSTVSKLESNKLEPDLTTINTLCDHFNITSDYLIGRTNEEEPEQTTSKNIVINNNYNM